MAADMTGFVFEISCSGERGLNGAVQTWSETVALPAWTALPAFSMRLSNSRWINSSSATTTRSCGAEQEMAIDRVEFEWRATFRVAPLVFVRVRDWCRRGVFKRVDTPGCGHDYPA